MHLGLRLPSNGPNAVADRIIEIGQLAEALGFDSLWGNDHIIMPANTPSTSTYGRLYETFITLAALATVTRRVQLGAGVLILPLRDPVLVAKQAATIDAYANGRMILGVGVGWVPEEYDFLNVEYGQRGKRCDEWLGIVRAVWQGTDINVSTDTYHIMGGVSEPTPVQPEGPLILIGGTADVALRRAALLGDGWIAGSYVSLEDLEIGVQKVKTQAPAGHKGVFYAFRRPTGTLAEPDAVDQMVSSLNTMQQIGVQGCVLALPEAYTADMVAKEVTLFAEKVMPLVR